MKFNNIRRLFLVGISNKYQQHFHEDIFRELLPFVNYQRYIFDIAFYALAYLPYPNFQKKGSKVPQAVPYRVLLSL